MTTWSSVSQKKHVYTWDFWSCKFSIIPWTIPSCKQYYSRKKDARTSVLKISTITAVQTFRQTSFQLFQHCLQHFNDFHRIIIYSYIFPLYNFFMPFSLVCLYNQLKASANESTFSSMLLSFLGCILLNDGIFICPAECLSCRYSEVSFVWAPAGCLFSRISARALISYQLYCIQEECLRPAIVADLAWRSAVSTKTSEWVTD